MRTSYGRREIEPLGRVVVDAREVVAEVHEQHVAIGSVPPVVARELVLEPRYSVVDAPALHVGGVAGGERRHDRGDERVLAQRLVYDPLAEVHGRYVPQLAALNEVELVEAAPDVLAVQQVLACLVDVAQNVEAVALNGRLPRHAAPRLHGGVVERVHVGDTLKREAVYSLGPVAGALFLAPSPAGSAPVV